MRKNKDKFKWDNLIKKEEKYSNLVFPKVSIIIPTLNCSHTIALTLEKLLVQNYPDFEIILIDADSKDRTLEVVKSYHNDKIKIYTVTEYNRYEMLNKGIALASGLYINFLFPGDFYIHKDTLKEIMSLALDHHKPHLVYSGCLLRDEKGEAKILYRQLSLESLKRGQQPTSLQSCWFRIDTFYIIGKFQITYKIRGGFDLLCRFCKHKNLTFTSTKHVLTDYDLRGITKDMVTQHFRDTFLIIYSNFGLLTLIRWLFIQKDFSRILKLWHHSIKTAFLGN